MKALLFLIVIFSYMNITAQHKISENVEIKNLGKTVNSAFSDFAPVISADGTEMYFTSRRPYTEKEIKKNKESNEHVYFTSYDPKKKKWTNAKMSGDNINKAGHNTSAIAISNDGQRLLIYHEDAFGNGDIYESKLKGNEWSEAVSLGEPINSKYHESSASISPDGRTIFFVSDRPGGRGGRDIWYCKEDENGKRGKAINIGQPINTQADEEGVFIHPDGKTLYFSSKGHNGSGGYDIYKSVNENGKWSQPVNMGKPLNTPDDDVFFVLDASGQKGYYTSAMKGGMGEKDIYEVIFPIDKKTKEQKSPQLILLKGVVSDEQDGKPLEASIDITDNEKNQLLSKLNSNSETGKYLVSLPAGKNYGINVSAENYLFYSENFNINDTASYAEIIKDIKLKKIEAGKKIELKNIFYDFDKATIRQESYPELDRLVSLLNENPKIYVEISSHTDNKGSDEYNLKLSQARAQSVVDYLIEKKIDKERLAAKGYGKTKPIATNDTEEGRQLNRRTEFLIIK